MAAASLEVRTSSEEIIHALNGETLLIDLKRYPSDVQEFYREWQRVQSEGSTYGWDVRVSDEARLGILVAAKLYRHLNS